MMAPDTGLTSSTLTPAPSTAQRTFADLRPYTSLSRLLTKSHTATVVAASLSVVCHRELSACCMHDSSGEVVTVPAHDALESAPVILVGVRSAAASQPS